MFQGGDGVLWEVAGLVLSFSVPDCVCGMQNAWFFTQTVGRNKLLNQSWCFVTVQILEF